MSIEKWVHPIPFRTRKLSASSPMILRIFTWESRPMPRLSLERLLKRSLSSFKSHESRGPTSRRRRFRRGVLLRFFCLRKEVVRCRGKGWPEAGREHVSLGRAQERGRKWGSRGKGMSAGARPPVRFGGHGARLRPAGKTGRGLMSPTGGRSQATPKLTFRRGGPLNLLVAVLPDGARDIFSFCEDVLFYGVNLGALYCLIFLYQH